MSETLIIILIGILGLIFGSFFCCMGYRIPNKVKVSVVRSFCPNCKKTLKWYMNIPVLSFIFLRGKCAYCKKPINYIYPFIEITTALLFICNYLMFDFTYQFYLSMIISSMLMVTVVSDFMYYYISDRVLLLGGLSTVVMLYIYYGFEYVFTNIFSGIILFILMILIKLIGNKVLKKESLGDGDIKLIGVTGIMLGLTNSLIALFIASLLGLVFSYIIIKKNKEGIIPFGPFILIGALIVVYFSNLIMPLIDRLLI